VTPITKKLFANYGFRGSRELPRSLHLTRDVPSSSRDPAC
jgi:hypothetical protein